MILQIRSMQTIGMALGAGLRAGSAAGSATRAVVASGQALETAGATTARTGMSTITNTTKAITSSKPLQGATVAAAVLGATSTLSDNPQPVPPSNDEKINTESNVFIDDSADVQNIIMPERNMPENDLPLDLVEFFATPLMIHQAQWDIGGALTGFEPWTLWFSNPAVKRKLANYWLISGKLRLKIVTNGNAFQYGKLIFGYGPCTTNDILRSAPAALSAYGVDRLPLQFSIDPTSDSVINVDLPWFWPREGRIDAANFPGSSLGFYEPAVLAPLQTTSTGALSPYVDITVYASMHDIKLSHRTTIIPTSAQEYGGVLSKPLATTAKVASMFKDIPVIGQYADMYSKSASVGAGLTSAFGFSKPNYVEQEKKEISKTFGALAHTDTNDTSTVLAGDPRANTIIDPRIGGLDGTDTLALAYWFQRESFTGSYDWTNAQVVGETVADIDVSPHYTTQTSPWTPSYLSYATMPFRAYRGGIKLRFEIPCNSFHTGRLQFTFEPATTTLVGDPTNVSLNVIMDLAKEKTLTLNLPWTSTDQWITNGTRYSLAALLSTGKIGRVNVKVISQLRAGGVATTLKLLVYISAGDDYEVNCLDFEALKGSVNEIAFSSADTPAAIPAATSIAGYYPYTVVIPTSDTMSLDVAEIGDSHPITPMFSELGFSERILSFRELMKRYVLYQVRPRRDPLNSAQPIESIVVQNMPKPRSYIMTYQGLRFNESLPWTVTAWMAAAHLAYRGGVRHKFITFDGGATLIAARLPFNTGINRYSNVTTTDLSTPLWHLNTSCGAELGKYVPNQGLEIQIPWADTTLFRFCARSFDQYFSEGGNASTMLTVLSHSDTSPVLHFTATADDFNFLFCLGPPVCYDITSG